MSLSSSAAGTAAAPSNLYRAVWRWHFYAGLLSLPFLILLAVTGALYLFRDEIDAIVHRDLKQAAITAAAPQPPSALIAAAQASQPGAVVLKYLPPATATASAEVGVKAGDAKLSVFVDPYSGRVLGALPDKGTVMGIVRRLHSLAYFGPVANGVIEIAGGWCILLTLTGLYLWWPRPRRGEPGGVLSVRGTPRRRVFWRDLHAVTGAVAGLFILFLAVSGMPWSVLWGDYVNQWANGHNFGYPNGVRVNVPMSDDHLEHTTWSLEQAQVPQSTAPTAAAPIGIDAAVAAFDRLGMTPGYSVALPKGAKGVYSASVYPDDLSRQRVVHLDQYSGAPLLDMSYADYGPLGKTLEWSINVHMGQEFGLANQLLMLAVCAAIAAVSVSAGVMWWKRRPRGTLGVPPLPAERRVLWGVTAILMIGGVIFPLVGASFLAMLAFDAVVVKRG